MRLERTQSPFGNRSDTLRRDRTQRSQKQAATASRRATNPAAPRPVTVRGNAFGTPIHRQSNTRPRRQYYVAMDQVGTEMRLPAIPAIHLGWRLASGLLVVLLTAAIYAMWSSAFFRIASIELIGLQRSDPAEITAALDLVNLSILEVNPQAIVSKIKQDYPDLTDVQLTVQLPNLVSFSATERVPVMAWQKGDQVTWVDAEGVAFPARGDAGALVTIHSESAIPLAPVLPTDLLTGEPEDQAPAGMAAAAAAAGSEGVNPETQEPAGSEPQPLSKIDPTLLSAGMALAQKLPPDATILYDPSNGLGWNDPQGWQVYIGKDLMNFEAKYGMYNKLSGFLVEQGLRPTLISVAQLNAPFYRLEQ